MEQERLAQAGAVWFPFLVLGYLEEGGARRQVWDRALPSTLL